MVNKRNNFIEIDLNQFKLHLHVKHRMEVSLHFDSPSRRFYLCLIALVVYEMKRLGKITSIPLEDQYETLTLLNETVGAGAGSSMKKALLPRIYRKWKDALPDLEHAPLFRVLGRAKEYGDAIGKTYPFTDEEKDAWANLFEYKGSHGNTRLRFSVDRLGATLDDVVIGFGEEPDIPGQYPWERFLEGLKRKVEEHDQPLEVDRVSPLGRRAWTRLWTLYAVIGLLMVIAIVLVWHFYLRPTKSQLESHRPSIAVLPFVNLSEDPEHKYFADGITDDLITDLSKISGLFVIARNSAFQYKGKSVAVKRVGRELGVRYILEGSVRRSGNRVRINAQLTDASTGGHLWAERYDGIMDEVFSLQDKVTRKIVAALAVKLMPGEETRIASKDTNNIESYDRFLKGWEHYLRETPEDYSEAIGYFEQALQLDPTYSRAYAAIALTYWRGSGFGTMWLSEIGGLSWPMARLKSRHYLEIALENPTSIAHQVASSLALDRRQHATAVAEAEKAIALSPNDPQSHIAMARAWIFTMRTSEAVDILKGLMQRDPRNIATPLCLQGLAYFTEGRVEEAVVSMERGLTHNPKLPRYSGVLASAYAQLGRDQEAKAALERFADEFVYTPSLQVVMYAFPFKDSKVADRLAAGLLEAGLEGQLTDYYNANDMRKLEAEEIRNLCFGRRMTGFDTIIGSDMWIERSEDGRAMMQDAWGSSDGKSWIEGDMLCNQWEARWGGLKHCCDVYHNPQGTSEMKNEYVTVSDFGIFALSVADRER